MSLQKLLRPFCQIMESKGIKAIIYIDDGIAAFCTFEPAKSAAN